VIIRFTKQADIDLDYFNRTGNKQAVKKIKELLKAISDAPFKGVGQPEPLKYGLSGAWSRRISGVHRLVYEVDGEVVYVLSLKGHYE
jgi:toxin YoeB